MKRYTFIQQIITLGVAAIFVFLLVTSCSSSKQASKPGPAKNQAALVSRKLGFSISNKDPNLPLYTEAANWIGVPYRYGGMTKKGADCSGLTYQVYKLVYKKTLPRTSSDLAKSVSNVSKNKLEPGDLVFFATSKNKNLINHVGIYLKGDYFLHASTKAGVMVSRLNEDYFKKTYKKSGRVKK